MQGDIYEPIQYSKWAAPVVPILKDDGTVRICGDDKQLTRHMFCDKYPKNLGFLCYIKRWGEISKLDLSHAYQELLLLPESRPLLTVNTHWVYFNQKDPSLAYILHQGYFKEKLRNV